MHTLQYFQTIEDVYYLTAFKAFNNIRFSYGNSNNKKIVNLSVNYKN